MKNILRQFSVLLTVIATITVNILANALPINGQNTGEISDRFHVYFVPAGYVFSIWGLIYIGLIAYAVYQALPSQRENPKLQSTGWWVSFGGLANIAWIFFWHYEIFPLTLVAMLALLVTLIIAYLRLRNSRGSVSASEKWAIYVPFSVYLGWISVATIANVTDLLDYWKWTAFGIAPEIWMGIMLMAVLVITTLMILTRGDIAYSLVILWALAGISIKQAAFPIVAISTWITFALVVLALASTFLVRKPDHKLLSAA